MGLESIIVWDIETIPTLDEARIATAEKVIRNKLENRYKRDSTIESHFKDEIEKLALNPLYNQVIAIGIVRPFRYEGLNPKVIFNLNEEELITDFAKIMIEYDDKFGSIKHCGYNITNFDLPVMRLKFARYRQASLNSIWPRSKYDVLDMYWDLGTPGTLDEVVNYVGLPQKYNGYSGKDVKTLLDKNQIDDIIAYTKQDALIEGQLARLIY